MKPTPERELWLAIIRQTVQDADNLIEKIKERRLENRDTMYLEVELNTLKRQLKDKWWNQICENAGENPKTIVKYLKRREKNGS